MTWTKKEILPPLPPEAQQIVDDLGTLSGSVVDILSATNSALDLVKNFFLASNDLFAVIMETLITTLEELINDLFGSGVFQLVVNPFTIGPTSLRRDRVVGDADQFNITFLTPSDAIREAIKSLDDPGDIDRKAFDAAKTPQNPNPNPTAFLKRPNFSNGATVTGFGLLVTAKDINLYITLLQRLLQVWTLKDIEFAVGRALEAKFGEPPRSRGADWDALKLNQIGPLGQVQNQLLKILALAKGYTLIPQGVTNLIDALQRKIDALTDTINTFQAVIDDLSDLQGLAGVHVLDIPPQVGGNNLLKASLPNPTLQGPEFEFHRYTFFLMYVGGGPTVVHPQVKAADTLRQLVAGFPNS